MYHAALGQVSRLSSLSVPLPFAVPWAVCWQGKDIVKMAPYLAGLYNFPDINLPADFSPRMMQVKLTQDCIISLRPKTLLVGT